MEVYHGGKSVFAFNASVLFEGVFPVLTVSEVVNLSIAYNTMCIQTQHCNVEKFNFFKYEALVSNM